MNATISIFKKAIVMLVVAVMTACGGSNSPQQTAGNTETKSEVKAKSGTEIKDLSEANWQAVVKVNYGIEANPPSGWKLKSVKSPNNVTNVNLVFEASDIAVAENFARSLFEAAKSVSSEGIFTLEYRNDRMERGEPFEDFNKAVSLRMDDSLIVSWNYIFDSKTVQFNFFFDNKKGAEISINRY